MNREKALAILDLSNNFNETDLKKKYHVLALRYHPDKNPETTQQFQEINTAYEYLKDNTQQHKAPEVDYSELIKSATNFIINKKLSNDFLNEMDITSLEKMKSYVILYNSLFNGVDELIDRINTIVTNKQRQLEEIILEPSLDDLLNQKVFKLKYQDKEYLVPLWHGIMYFTNDNHNIMVKCYPKLPSHIDINDNNDIIVYIKKNIQECLEMESISIQLGSKQVKINNENLKLVKKQCYTIENAGIPRINEKKFYNIEEISNIIVNIELV
tara:strand:- start:2137 stop:2946 length:810 start_codon:yes stop_codon:yes gene_type:complete